MFGQGLHRGKTPISEGFQLFPMNYGFQFLSPGKEKESLAIFKTKTALSWQRAAPGDGGNSPLLETSL